MVTLTTNHGSYRGSDLVSIVHREYGPDAQPMKAPDPADPNWGVVVTNEQCGTQVVATIIRVDD